MIFLGTLPKHFGCKTQQPVSVEELVNSQTMFKVNILFTLLIIIMIIIKLIRIIIISIFMKIRY